MHPCATACHPRRHLHSLLLLVALIGMSLFALTTLHGPSRAATADAGPCGAELEFHTSAGIVCAHGDDAAFAAGTPSTDSITALPIPCHGDGTSGNRIAAYYAYLAGRPNRIADVRRQLRNALEQADDIVYQSARQTGGYRALRVVTTAKCVPVIRVIQLPSSAATSFGATIEAAQSAGLHAPNRKYVLFVDSNNVCGVATLRYDDRAGSANVNNIGPSWARVDRGCWTGAPTAHEIFHMLGAVQQSAPHFDNTGHCTDDHDLMCYQNAGGKRVTIRCLRLFGEDRLDCGKDDYFNTKPRAGSYLARHWNTANSSFLYGTSVAASVVPPALVPGLAVTMLSPTTARVHWSAPAGRVTGYDVMKDGLPLWHGTETHWDDILAIASTGQYQVRAVNSSGAGPWSAAVDAQLPAPPAPSSVTSTGPTSVAWTGNSSLVDAYLFYGVSSDGSAHYLSTLPASARNATDYTWSLFRSWNRYRVCAYNSTATTCRDESS